MSNPNPNNSLSNNVNNNTSLHALLIGIDYYSPNTLEGGVYYPSLGGCVRDINHVEDFLKTFMKVSKQSILKLTCSINNGQDKPLEPPEKWPTYQNIIAAFDKITERSLPGDQIYIHYSGHGGRVKTLIPKLKGENGLDETLVPTDIGDPGTRYLRDIEIAKMLKKMVDKKLNVTLVLDSCHSGGATRGRGGAAVRGTSIIDTAFRPQDSLLAPIDELASIWRQQQVPPPEQSRPPATSLKQTTRGLEAESSGWIPQPKGYVLLAACRPSESAYEYAFEKDEKNGALTYWLLKSLKQIDKTLTYKIIHDRLVAKIHSQFPLQTPMLEGDLDREIFGSDRIQPVYAVNVMQIDRQNNKILLNAGQAHGIRKGTKFAIYPLAFTDFSQVDRRLALVEVQERGSTNSWAHVIAEFNRGSVEEGAQAILIDPVDISLKRIVRLVYQSHVNTRPTSVNKTQKDALDRIKNIIIPEGKGFLELAAEDKDKSDYQVSINEKGEYEIWDPAGMLVPNLNPPLKVDDSNSAIQLVQRLVHLTKYSNIQRLDNQDPASPLSRKLIVELYGVPQSYEPGDRPDNQLQPIESEGNIKVVKVGQKMVLRIKNTLPNDSNRVLNVAILDLQPDGGVTQVYPMAVGDNFLPIDPGDEQFFPLQAGLPSGYREGKDIIKVFATIDQTSFRWLELPPLDQPAIPKEVSRGMDSDPHPSNPLEQLMAAITKDKPATRDLSPSATPSKEWTTAQIEVKIYNQ